MKRRAFVTASTLSVTGLSECLGDTEYRITDAAVETPLKGPSLSADLVVADATIRHPAALTLSLGNTTDGPIRIRSYGVWPFSALIPTPSLTPGEDMWKTTLFSPSCETGARVEVSRDELSLSPDGTPVTRPLDTGGNVSGRYELHGDDFSGSETQYVIDRFERKVSRYAAGDDWNALDYRLRLGIDERGRFPF